MLSGGRRNLIHANYFINSVEQDIYFADQGLTWQQKIAWENCTVAMGQGACLITELEMFNYKTPPYATAYPWSCLLFLQTIPVGRSAMSWPATTCTATPRARA